MHPMTKETQSAMTPAEALALLKEGNQRFRSNLCLNRDLLGQVKRTGDGQFPFAAVLSCIDSRVPVEKIFYLGIGDVFSVRIAGNIVNEDILGSIEFACHVAGAKLVLVLGHTRCGAVKGACDDVKLGHLTTMLEKLRPAVEAATEPRDPGQRNSGNPDFVEEVALRNVELSMGQIRRKSELLRRLEEQGAIAIVGARYDVTDGVVEFLDSPPRPPRRA